MKPKTMWQLAKETFQGWSANNATRLAAALAFYTVLSIAPLLVLAVAVAGLVFGEDAARGKIASELSSIVGPSADEGIQTLLSHARPRRGHRRLAGREGAAASRLRSHTRVTRPRDSWAVG